MVSVGEAETATGEAASAVSDLESAAQGRGDRASAATNAEDLSTFLPVRYADDTAIAGYPPRRFRRNVHAVLQLRSTVLTILRQSGGLDM